MKKVSMIIFAVCFILTAAAGSAFSFNWTPRDSVRNWYSVASSADGTKLVALVFSGQIYTSTDSGGTWTARDSSRNWESVASSADGTKLVAVASTGQIYTSTDSGVTWTARDSTRNWISVASSADGTKLVAVEMGGQIYTSTDSGVNWTARDSVRAWRSVASSADGTKLVALVYNGQIYTSTDSGVTWTAKESSRTWKSVASSADGTKLVAVVLTGQIYTSTDSGVTWTPRESSRTWTSVASSADGTKLVAVGSGEKIYTSADSGISWNAEESVRAWQSVASSSDGTKLVAVVGGGGQIYTGVPPAFTWTARDSVRDWRSVASSADGTKLVAGVYNTGSIYTSTDSGLTWTARDSSRYWLSVASSADGTKLVAGVLFSGLIYTSTDSGVNWTPRESSRNWMSVASSADGTKLVAGTGGGQIYTSTDSGVNWTPRESNRQWYSVASSADGTKLVAVDYGSPNGFIYTSTDSGVNWTPRESSRSWYSVASSADGTKLVAVVFGGQIYTSTDSGVNWTPRESSRSWYSVASSADGTKLAAVVNGGQIYTSADSGVSWNAEESARNWKSVASSSDGTKLVAVDYGGQIYTGVASTPAPTTQPSGGSVGSVSSTSMTISWTTNGDGSNRIVLVKAGSAVDSPPVDGTGYTANTVFSVAPASQIGTGNYVVYNGAGNSVTVTGLSASTTYHYSVYEFNGSGTTANYLTTSPLTGNQATTAGVTTPTTQPSGGSVGGVSNTSMTISWTTNGDGSDRIVLVKAGTAVDSPPVDSTGYTANTVFSVAPASQIGTGNYVVYNSNGNSVTVTGLSPSTTYHYSVYSFNGSGGTEKYLTTSPMTGSQATTATVTTPTTQPSGGSVGGVSSTSMSISWTTNGNGSNRIVLVKAGSAVDSPPVDSTGYTANTVFSVAPASQIGSGNYVVYNGTGNSVSLTGLNPSTTYYYSVCEFNGSGGTEKYFTTSPMTGSQVTTATTTTPTTQPSGGSVGSVSSTSMTISWTTNGDGSNRIVLVKAGAAVDSPPVDSTGYTANTVFGVAPASQIGTGNYVVYNSTGNSVTVTGLSASTTYYYSVFGFNGSGGTEKYFTTSPMTGSQATTAAVTTPATPASGAGVGSTGSTSVTINFIPGSGTSRIVVFYPTATGAGFTPADGTGYTATAFGTGAVAADTYVVYNGSGSSFTVTGLTAGTSYSYAVYEYNGSGGTAKYLTGSALTGTVSTTSPVTAGVTLTGLSSITGSTVLATGNATGAGIGERGFYWWIPPTTATHFGGSESGLIPEGYGAGSFSLKLTDLRPGHGYHLKAYVKVGGQIITSDEQTFTTATTGATGKAAPTVLTDTKNFTVSGSSITVSGEITDIGSSAVNVYGFVYAPHTAPFTGHEMPKTGDMAYAMWDKAPVYQGMKFTGTIKNIPPGKWYLRAYAHNTNPDSSADQPESLGYGEDISFTIACTPETCIPGDVNGDGKVSLDDAMLVLRILAGMSVGNVNLNADVNGDGKIGLEELGYILQKVAELRPSGT